MDLNPLAAGKGLPGGLRAAFFLAALALYGLAGSPTPESFGVIEGLIAALLVAGVGVEGAARSCGWGGRGLSSSSSFSSSSAFLSGQALLFYGLSVPLAMGVFQGNASAAVLRDVIPFLFFLLPLFSGALVEKDRFPEALRVVALGIGLCFALRDLARIATDLAGFSFLTAVAADPLSYLANAPTVLFAGLFLTGRAGELILKGSRMRDFLIAGLMLLMALAPFAVMALSLQRASIGLAALVAGLWLAGVFLRSPLRALRLLVPLALAGLATLPFLEILGGALLAKTQSVGLNSRLEEIGAIWRIVSARPLTLLFGEGWGAHFASPAVGGLSVNFAHSMPAALLLKAGLAGVLLAGFYLAGFLKPFWRLLRRAPVLALSLAAPLVIDSFLYAAYKSLDFGVILLLLWAAAYAEGQRDSRPQEGSAGTRAL